MDRAGKRQEGGLMYIYIVEDDESVVTMLEDIIQDNELGKVCGSSGTHGADTEEILALSPDVLLMDFLIPGKDGVEVLRELRSSGLKAKVVMISQVSAKNMIGKAYEAGVDFYISKPINIREVTAVIRNAESQLKNERTIDNLRTMLLSEAVRTGAAPSQPGPGNYEKKLRYILTKLGMAGERGASDIISVCLYLKDRQDSAAGWSVSGICAKLSDSPKIMEQRMRRSIAVGMSTIANMGIEDYMNEIFAEFSGTLFPFEEVRREMDFVRGKRSSGGKAGIRKFIDGLMAEAERSEN